MAPRPRGRSADGLTDSGTTPRAQRARGPLAVRRRLRPYRSGPRQRPGRPLPARSRTRN